MLYRSILVVSIFLAAALVSSQSAPAPARPPIVGVAHIAVKTRDLPAAREFYGRYLGFAEPFQREPASDGAARACFKVNDHQYIELSANLKSDTESRLVNIAYETPDARKLRDFLAAQGIDVPARLQPDADGNLTLVTKDPAGYDVRFVQYLSGSLQGRNFGKALPDTRISERIIHVGAIIDDRAAANRFYQDVLGFQEFWWGGRADDHADWVDMRVPNGKDWMEYMVSVTNRTPRSMGVNNHMALGVPSVDASYKKLLERGMKIADPPKIGRDGKWQLNLYDPDLTRAELMEPKPVQTPCCSPMKP